VRGSLITIVFTVAYMLRFLLQRLLQILLQALLQNLSKYSPLKRNSRSEWRDVATWRYGYSHFNSI
jgi:hypothetical protein